MRLVTLFVTLLAGCGGPPLCASSMQCGQGRVCGLSGACEVFGAPRGARFAASRWLDPTDWGVAGGPAELGDTLAVGGRGAETLLAFGPLPTESRVLRALLVLHPHERTGRVEQPAELVVEHVEPFRGGALPARIGALPLSFAAARRQVGEGPARSIRFDVTEAARSAAERDDRRLHLLVRTREATSSPLLYASPWHSDARAHPRLELLLH